MQFILSVKINNSDENRINFTCKVFKQFPKISDGCRIDGCRD